MATKGSAVLFSALNLMSATALSFAGIQGIKQLINYGDCREVCSYARIAFGAKGLSDELVLVIILVLSFIHLIGGLSALNTSESGLMVFVSAYVLRFMILAIDSVLKMLVSSQDWRELLLMIDRKQTKFANDFRLCITVIQVWFLLWAIALMVRFRYMAYKRIKQRSLRMILESWISDAKRKSLH